MDTRIRRHGTAEIGRVLPMGLVFSISAFYDYPEVGVMLILSWIAIPSRRRAELTQLAQNAVSNTGLDKVFLIQAYRMKLAFFFVCWLCVAVVMDWMPTATIVGSALFYVFVEQSADWRIFRKEAKLQPSQMTALPGFRGSGGCAESRSEEVSLGKPPIQFIPQVIDNFAIAPGSMEAEIAQVVRSCTPNAQDEDLGRQVARAAEEQMSHIVPGVKVECTMEANLEIIGKAGDKPEINMVVTVDDAVLRDSLCNKILNSKARTKRSLSTLLPDAIRKTATKMLAQHLVFARFWRSQLKGREPTIVLIIPASEGYCRYPLRMNLSVNNPMPMRLVDLLKSSSKLVNHLTLLVIKFARQRCMINISRGQPPAYTWAVLVTHFCRQSGLFLESKGVGGLFSEFLKFYKSILKPRTKINIRFTRQALLGSPVTQTVYIEDPADLKRNCAEHISDDGLVRVSEEIERASLIMSREGDGRIAEILQRWIPDDAQAASQATEEAVEGPCDDN